MSKAIKSDGSVNRLVFELCMKGLDKYKIEVVDKVLKDDDKLKQCKLETLYYAGYAYIMAYGKKNWFIQRHIEIKAQQSEEYRKYKESLKHGTTKHALTENVESDPMSELLGLSKSDDVMADMPSIVEPDDKKIF